MTDEKPVPIGEQLTPRAARKSRTPEPAEPAELAAAQVDEFRVLDPFEGKTTRVEGVTGLYHVEQVRDEVAAAAGLQPSEVQIALVLEDPYSESSESNPGVVYVSPAVDVKIVKKALADHKADPQYGMSEGQLTWLAIKAKIAGDDELSPTEMRDALRVLADRM